MGGDCPTQEFTQPTSSVDSPREIQSRHVARLRELTPVAWVSQNERSHNLAVTRRSDISAKDLLLACLRHILPYGAESPSERANIVSASIFFVTAFSPRPAY